VCSFWQLSLQNKNNNCLDNDSIIVCFRLKLRIVKIDLHYVDLDVFIPT
jgi:hypothetical protein